MANTKKYVSFDKLRFYDEKIKKVVTDGDAAALQSAKDYADSLATNYDAAGTGATEAGKVQTKLDEEVARAKAREDEIAGLVATAQGEVDALETVVAGKAAQADLDALVGKVGEVPTDKTVMGIINQIQENAYDDTELKAEINGKLDLKADKTQVATDIAAAVKVEEEARIAAVSGVQNAVDTLSGTHATDKAALEGAIALKADQTDLDAVSAIANAAATKVALEAEVKRATDEETRIEGLLTDEIKRATDVEADFEERLVEVETFFKTAEGQTIDEALDTLVELQTYLNGEGAVADQMVKDIAANAKAIEDMDAAYKEADETLQGNIDELAQTVGTKAAQADLETLAGRVTTAEGKITTAEGKIAEAEGKVATLEGEMDAVEAAVATKVEQEAYNTKVAALEGADAGQVERIAALEAKFGGAEGSVEDMIADAKAEAIEAAAGDATTKANKALEDAKKYADEEDAKIESRVDALEAASAKHALASDLTTLAGRVTTAEGKVTTLEGEMDAVEALAAANESAIKALQTASATHALKTEVEAVSGRVTALETWHNNFTEVSEEDINSLFQ